jgi:ABC-type glycerol-3-phosphate transport system substrate-binding protein
MSQPREHHAGGDRNTAMRHCRAAIVLLFLGLLGCGGERVATDKKTDKKSGDSAATPSEAAPANLKLAIVGDDPNGDAALGEAIARLWSTEEGGQLDVNYIFCGPAQSLSPEDAKAALSGDAVIYPVGLLGEFAERDGLLAIPAEALRSRTFGRREIFDFAREQAGTWGEKAYGFPLGSPQLTLYYRADVFERLGLSPPRTWEEFQQTAEKLAAESPSLATLEPLGPGWGSQMLLARAAPYARHRSQYSTLFNYSTMEPLVAGPPFVRALEELAEATKLRGKEMLRMSPHQTRSAFWQGGAGMALTWPTAADRGNAEDVPQDESPTAESHTDENGPIPVAFAELPGAPSAYNNRSGKWEAKPADESHSTPLLGIAGRTASVTRGSKHSETAFHLLSKISGAEWGGQLGPLCRDTTLYRPAHVAVPTKWVEEAAPLAAAKQYAELSQKMQSGSTWLSSPAIPGRAEYLAALDEAVWSVVERGEPAQAALDAAARQWRKITERLGVESQRQAYERSLGLEP